MAIDRRSYTAGHFELMIDGTIIPAYLKSVEGGFAKVNVGDSHTGGSPVRIKHVTTREIAPLSLEIGMSEVGPLWLWIAQSWRGEYNERDGHVIHADQNYKEQFVQDFLRALIAEVTFPALDASSKDPLYMKVKIHPEEIQIREGDRTSKISAPDTRKQKLWQSSAFRLSLKDRDTSKVNKIESFTIKQGIKTLNMGPHRFPELVPTGVTFPDIKCQMSLQHASSILDWSQEMLRDGKRETEYETDGAIEFLSPDRKRVLGTVNLYGVGLKNFEVPKSEANSDQIKRCSFELYVSHMGLNDSDIRMLLEG